MIIKLLNNFIVNFVITFLLFHLSLHCLMMVNNYFMSPAQENMFTKSSIEIYDRLPLEAGALASLIPML